MDNIPLSTPTPAPVPPLKNDIEENKDIAALSYAWILSVIIYFFKKDSPFVRFHAKQGIVLFILSLLVWTLPIVGRFFELLILALCVLGFLGAAQGQWKDLPIIGDMASGRWSHVRESWKQVMQSIVHLWQRLLHIIPKDKPANPQSQPASSAATMPDNPESPSNQNPNPNPFPPTV